MFTTLPVVGREATAQLVAVHEQLWDPARGLMLVPAGTTPGIDLGALGLHSVRESALGALLDLRTGRTDRALTALREVLDLQYDAPGRPWDGTFPVTAEQEDPPEDALEFLHYDPNWRQFLGTVLLVVVLEFADLLPPDIVDDAWAAVVRCATGEPADRIPDWYTNPNLLHAWVAAHAGRHTGDTQLLQSGEVRARRAVDRVAVTGDVDEYNSPTYDGVDLIATTLWSAYPPAPEFEEWGAQLTAVLCRRISLLVDSGTGVVCGPYSRAYGYDLTRYVSLLGLWLAAAGVTGTLPPELDGSTDHVHDLFFLPLVEHLSNTVPLSWDLRPVSEPRRHVQVVGGVVATSLLEPGQAVGHAAGPVVGSLGDQYVPFTVHVGGSTGDVEYVVARPGLACSRLEVEAQRPGLFVVQVEQGGGYVRWTCSGPPTVDDRTFVVGPFTVAWSSGSGCEVVTAPNGDTDVLVSGEDITYTVEVRQP